MNPEISPKLLGRRLKDERNRLGLSQEKFAEIGGVKRATQYMYEQGDRSPSADYIARVLVAGVDLGYLFFGERTGAAAGSWNKSKDIVLAAFKLVDEFGRDNKGRLLDIEYRMTLFESLCDVLADKPVDEIDWEDVRDNLKESAA